MAVPMTQALEALSANLIRAAETQQAVAVRRAMLAAVAPAPGLIRQSAMETLPKRGGANVWFADATTKVTTTAGVRSAAVVVRTRKAGTGISGKGHDLQSVDAGLIRHPVFGTWRAGVGPVRVRPGFFSRPMREETTPAVTAAMVAVMRVTGEAVMKG